MLLLLSCGMPLSIGGSLIFARPAVSTTRYETPAPPALAGVMSSEIRFCSHCGNQGKDARRFLRTCLSHRLFIRLKMAYSQCDHASPCSSCFFLLRASTRRRSEHPSQMVISDGSPHTLQTWRACSNRGSDCSRRTTFMFASRCTEAEGGPKPRPLLILL